jgi:hypothetical protein
MAGDAIDRLPEHLKSRKTGEAIMAPSAIVAAGAGASVAILAGAPVVAIVGVGVLAYAAVVGFKLPRRAKGPREERIDPRALSEPWSRFVSEALQARRRFDEVVRTADTGPIRERLGEIGERVAAAVHECWRIAKRGDALVAGVRSLDLDGVKRELDAVEQEQRRGGATGSLDQTAASLKAQLASGERLVKVATDTRDRLQLLDARLDEAVARAVELSLQAGDVADLSGLGDDVDSLLGDLESLRQGLDEAGQAAGLQRGATSA